MKKRILPSERKVKHQLSMVDINKNNSVEVDHTIRKIKEKELRLTLMWTCVFLLVFIISACTVLFSVLKIKEYRIVESGDLIIEFDEKENTLDDIITLDNRNILSYDEGLKSRNYSFKIKNKSKKDNKYKITLIDDYEMMLLDECSEMQFDKSKMYFSLNDKIIGLVSDLYNGEEYIIYEDVIKGETELSFDFKIWIDKSYINNGHYHGIIIVEEM